MKVEMRKPWGMAVAAGMFASVAMLPQAKGELVYENNSQPVAAKAEDREATRQVIQTAEKVQVGTPAPVAAPAPAQAVAPTAVTVSVGSPAPVVAPAPAPAVEPAAAASAVEPQNMSRSELLRRERMRSELKNEDVLQERLEELRLRDEKARTDEILNSKAAPVQAPMTTTPMTSVQVVAPVTEKPVAAPSGAVPAPAPVAVAPSNEAVGGMSAAVVAKPGEEDEKINFSVSPRIGVSNMMNSTYDVRPHFSAGVAGGLVVADNITIEFGYQYNEYGVNIGSNAPFVNWMNGGMGYSYGYSPYGYGAANAGYNFETQVLRQNVFEGGVKVHVVGKDSRVRPFIGAGGAYGHSYMNYNPRVINGLNQVPGYGSLGLNQDYTINSFMGYLSAGLDVKVSKSISVGVTFKYYNVFSANENGAVNNFAFYGPTAGYGYYGAPYAALANSEKAVVGGSLARTNFYSALAGMTFTF